MQKIVTLINDVHQIALSMKTKSIPFEDLCKLQEATKKVNYILYHTHQLRFQNEYDLNKDEDYFSYCGELLALCDLWTLSLNRRVGNSVDIEFWKTYEYFKYANIDDIYQTVILHFLKLPESYRNEYLSLPRRYTFLKEHLDYTNDDYSLIERHVELMVNSVEKYKWLYEHLADYRSKLILNGIIRYWFELDINKLHSLLETAFSDYYDMDILQCDNNEVMVDLGAFTGDSIEDFIASYGMYKRIYAYEITPSTFDIMQNRLAKYPNIVLNRKGVGCQKDLLYVNNGGARAGNKLLQAGDAQVEVVTLDEDISEPISIIKMDIEGAEKDAIIGATQHIKNEKPRLLISAYHLPEDIFDIPYLINDIRDDYKFYLRFNGHGCLWPCDYVLFAV